MSTGPSGRINVATMNKAVAASVTITLRTTPRCWPSHPQTALPKAPPPKSKARPTPRGRSAAAFSLDEKRKEQQIAHARRSIECADGEEQVEAAAVLSSGLNFLLDRSNERLLRQ